MPTKPKHQNPAKLLELINKNFREGDYATVHHISGEGDKYLLLYGPCGMIKSVSDCLGREKIGATIYHANDIHSLSSLLKEDYYDLFIYHASKNHLMPPTPGEYVAKEVLPGFTPPKMLRAMLLGYGTAFPYPKETISEHDRLFEQELLNLLKENKLEVPK